MKRKVPIRVHATAWVFWEIVELDRKHIGSPHYMGLAFFWHYDFRHDLRDASPAVRVRVHDAFLRAGLPVDGNTSAHYDIVTRITSRAAKGARK